MKIPVNESEQLYARGYRDQTAPLGGSRAVLDAGLPGVYVTLAPSERGNIVWTVLKHKSGTTVARGCEDTAIHAADKAASWILEEWQ